MECSMSDETEPWQKGSFVETNLYMLEKEILCDVTLLAGKKEEPVRAHKFMLASRSPVLYAMFCGPLAESKEAIRVPDIEADILRIAIKYIYTDDCTVSGENATTLLYAAQKYGLEGLIKKCYQFLTEYIDKDNVCTILQQALLYNNQDLKNDCLAYIVDDNVEDVLQADSLKHLNKPTLMKVIELDELDVEEEHVYKACFEWAKHQCITNEKDVSDQNIRECLGEILYLIRFPTMPIETFTEVVSKNGVLSRDEKEEVFQNFLGTLNRSPKFSTSERNYRVKEEIVKRFDTIEKQWGHDGSTDAISFSCSQDVKLIGVSLFTPVDVGSTEGPFEILEGDQTIYKQHVKLTYNISKQYVDYIFTLKGTVKLKAGKEYTLKQTLRGQTTYRGSNETGNIDSNNVSVQFIKSRYDRNGTGVGIGQFYRLILRARKKTPIE